MFVTKTDARPPPPPSDNTTQPQTSKTTRNVKPSKKLKNFWSPHRSCSRTRVDCNEVNWGGDSTPPKINDNSMANNRFVGNNGNGCGPKKEKRFSIDDAFEEETDEAIKVYGTAGTPTGVNGNGISDCNGVKIDNGRFVCIHNVYL